ncbi:unnamed protein product, partial [Brenthis ino]
MSRRVLVPRYRSGCEGASARTREPPVETRRHRVGLLVMVNYNNYYRSKLFQNERTRNSGCAPALSLPRIQAFVKLHRVTSASDGSV